MSLGKAHTAEFHGFQLLLSVPSSKAGSGTAAWNFLSGKANVIHSQKCIFIKDN